MVPECGKPATIDQRVNVLSETLQVGTREPVVTATRMTSTGQAINAVTYQQVGAIIRLTGQFPGAGRQARATGGDAGGGIGGAGRE